MANKQKIVGLLVSAIGVSVLALAGKQVADKYRRHTEIKINKPPMPAAKDEYTRLVQKFMAADSVTASAGTITLYDGERPGFIKEKSNFLSLKDKRMFYSKMSFVEVMYNGKYFVQVDSLHKILMVAGVLSPMPAAPATPETGGMFDKLFSDTASFRVSGTVDGDDHQRTITIHSDFNPNIQYFALHYSPADYTIDGAEIRFWKRQSPEPDSSGNNKVWISKITYRPVTKQEQPDINQRIARIFSVRKDKVVPLYAYRDYRIMVK